MLVDESSLTFWQIVAGCVAAFLVISQFLLIKHIRDELRGLRRDLHPWRKKDAADEVLNLLGKET